MTSKELYSKGSQIWVPHATLVWEQAEITSDYNNSELSIKFEDGRAKTIKVESENCLPPLRNPEILIGENDLTALSYLHEPAVLHNLKYRFCSLYTIYTYCGIVLVAINPYDELHIYDNDTILTYRGKSQGDLDPHIFAVAEEAYAKLEREGKNQSIIVSGESGAGKTVSAKYAMRYFATVGGSSQETQVEKKVLASSPIMEAIGNAKTTRNDNSSRFGKFIEIKFNKSYHIVGASMRTYLLEKSRVVFQASSERNYHIFYQLCSARKQLSYLNLNHQDKFLYLNQGESPMIEGVDDYDLFQETLQALNVLGFSRNDQENMFKVLAAILHLGNIVINKEDEGSSVKKDDIHLKIFCDLLQLNCDDMGLWLCQRKIQSLKEAFTKPMSLQESIAGKEALSKHMYAELFNWIVSVINNALETSREKSEHSLIGVLDIYGFETFEINSFEQFCINYANEKLQQQFNQHVFKLEQEEYLKEEIEWKFIDFHDNQPCIDLIESKLGILDLLDEECRMPKGTDLSWVEKLYATCSKYKHFSKPRFGVASFVIRHFADSVEYQVDGFLDKNRDSVLEEQINVLKGSQNDLVKKLFADEQTTQSSARIKITPLGKSASEKSRQHKKTVGSQFRDNLNLLMVTLNATTPHYVRCIKPNDFKKAFDYNPQRAVQQLRACGVLETIRISAAGFPSRWLYGDFFARYRVLCKFKDIDRGNMKATCSKILFDHISEPDKYQFGKTKIFFRAGQVAFLEKLRAERLRAYCVIIQKQIRAFILRKKYLRTKYCVFHLQKHIRGYLARRRALFLRQTKAATTLQRYLRGWIKRNQYRSVRNVIIGLQSFIRGHLAKKRYLEMRYNNKAIIIQRHMRGFIARRQYKRNVRRVVVCQNAVRRFLAKRKLKELKKEARSVEYVKKLNKGLENKIISLQQKIGELTKENNQLKSLQHECNDLRVKVDALRHLESEMKRTLVRLKEKDKEINLLNEKISLEQSEKMDVLQEVAKTKEILDGYIDTNRNLKMELDSINEKIKKNQCGVEENIKARIQQEKTMLIHEHERDLENYQKLLKEYSALEQRNEHLEALVEKLTSRHSRSPSDASSLQSSQTSTEMENDDFGYSSNKSTISRRDDPTESLEKDRSLTEFTERKIHDLVEFPEIDVGLVLKLQQRLKDVEKERDKLFLKVENLEREESPTEERQKTMDAIRFEELEMENEKLKSDLAVLRESLAMGDPGTKELLNQFRASEKELDRRREEIVQLRTVLATQTKGLKNIAKINYGSANDVSLEMINEDGELVMAFEAQKGVNRQLEDELQQEKEKRKAERDEYKSEIEKLKEDNDRQQKLLSVNLNKSPQSQTEAYMQHEISRLTTENLDLQEKFDAVQDSIRKLKKQNKLLVKKLKELGVGLDQVEEQEQRAMAPSKPTKKPDEGDSLPIVMMKKERNYQGMFEYRTEDEPLIIKHLIYDLKPRVAVYLLPGLPAYIFFMCIRHTDFVNDEAKVKSLLTAFINAVKKVIRKKHDDLETTVLWLSNTLRLLHNLKQYSGDKIFQHENTAKQNEQCLGKFDLSQYRQVLSDMAVWIYQGAIRDLQEKIQQVIVPAVLEHEALPGLSKGLAGRLRASSVSSASDSATHPQKKLDALLGELTAFHRILAIFGVDPEVISQVFRQTFYFICACSLNNLLLRKDLCHWTKGMQIRYNLSHLEDWARNQLLTDPAITETLQPIVQASHLLQARKTEKDIKSLCEMCDKLTVQRIVKLLHLYTPADDYEEKVPVSFLRKIQAELQSRASPAQQDAPLLMDTKFVFPVRFPFNPSNIRLEDIEIPGDLNLPMLKKV